MSLFYRTAAFARWTTMLIIANVMVVSPWSSFAWLLRLFGLFRYFQSHSLLSLFMLVMLFQSEPYLICPSAFGSYSLL